MLDLINAINSELTNSDIKNIVSTSAEKALLFFSRWGSQIAPYDAQEMKILERRYASSKTISLDDEIVYGERCFVQSEQALKILTDHIHDKQGMKAMHDYLKEEHYKHAKERGGKAAEEMRTDYNYLTYGFTPFHGYRWAVPLANEMAKLANTSVPDLIPFKENGGGYKLTYKLDGRWYTMTEVYLNPDNYVVPPNVMDGPHQRLPHWHHGMVSTHLNDDLCGRLEKDFVAKLVKDDPSVHEKARNDPNYKKIMDKEHTKMINAAIGKTRDKFWQRIEELNSKAMNFDLKPNDVNSLKAFYDTVIEIIWLIGNMTPTKRGTGKTVEQYFAAIHRRHNLNTPILKRVNPQLDVLNLTLPLSEYLKRFLKSFEPDTLQPVLAKDIYASQIQDYINQREQKGGGRFHLLGKHKSKTTKLRAAKKMVQLLRGNAGISLDKHEYYALLDSTLGGIVNAIPPRFLPEEFKNAAQQYQPSQDELEDANRQSRLISKLFMK